MPTNTGIVWDEIGEHFYETGVDHGVHYTVKEDKTYGKGVAWNGLTSVNETPSGAESTAVFADNMKYLNLVSAEDFGLTIEAYTYPDAFAECDGSAQPVPGVVIGQQARKAFGFSYRTKIGNDILNDNLGYKLHLAYGCLASPSQRSYSTTNESPEATTMSWEVKTTPVSVTGYRPTALLTIDSTVVPKEKMAALEAILYGTNGEEARMPLPDEVFTLLETSASSL